MTTVLTYIYLLICDYGSFTCTSFVILVLASSNQNIVNHHSSCEGFKAKLRNLTEKPTLCYLADLEKPFGFYEVKILFKHTSRSLNYKLQQFKKAGYLRRECNEPPLPFMLSSLHWSLMLLLLALEKSKLQRETRMVTGWGWLPSCMHCFSVGTLLLAMTIVTVWEGG